MSNPAGTMVVFRPASTSTPTVETDGRLALWITGFVALIVFAGLTATHGIGFAGKVYLTIIVVLVTAWLADRLPASAPTCE